MVEATLPLSGALEPNVGGQEVYIPANDTNDAEFLAFLGSVDAAPESFLLAMQNALDNSAFEELGVMVEIMALRPGIFQDFVLKLAQFNRVEARRIAAYVVSQNPSDYSVIKDLLLADPDSEVQAILNQLSQQ